LQAWVGHPYYDVIDNTTNFDLKVMKMIAVSTVVLLQKSRPANKYDFGGFVRFFAEISPKGRQYDLRPK
jgi:hypothetical protein